MQDGVRAAQHLAHPEQVGELGDLFLGRVDHAVGLDDQRRPGRQCEQRGGQGHQVPHQMDVYEVGAAHHAACGVQQRGGGDTADLEHREQVPGLEEVDRNSLDMAGQFAVGETVSEGHDAGVVPGGPLDLGQVERHPGRTAEGVVRGMERDDVQDFHQSSPRLRQVVHRVVIGSPQVG
ncbi:hypothetical protein Smic_64940 [Streptomyces microflavus]|uniref:Uncharacterized protein n=1 Tax=Streptomyces microflavus TaxID=1919 RepID=A0A7J0CZS9_STRMI|nr:hypothetical protein Smic_64940 [Streptomyces microflavus]